MSSGIKNRAYSQKTPTSPHDLRLNFQGLRMDQHQCPGHWKRYSTTRNNQNSNTSNNLQRYLRNTCPPNKSYTHRQSSNLQPYDHHQSTKNSTMNEQNQNSSMKAIMNKFSKQTHKKAQHQAERNPRMSNPTYFALQILHQRKSKKQESLKNLEKKVNEFAYIADHINIKDRCKKKATQIDDPISPLQWKTMRSTNSNSSPRKSTRHTLTIKDFNIMLKCKGTFGELYLAQHWVTGLIFGIKKLSKAQIKDKKLVDRLIQQSKIQMYMNNASIVKMYTIFDDHDHIYMLLEYMQGGSLYSYLQKETGRVLDEEQAAGKLISIMEGVDQLHKNGIIHRDIKPQNIVMSHGYCKMCDFGCSVITKGRRQTYCGTFDYLAPEIFKGEKYDYKVDIWQLGILAYEILNGQQPFYSISKAQSHDRIIQFDDQLTFKKQLSNCARNIISKMLKKNPQDRSNTTQLLLHQFFISNLQDEINCLSPVKSYSK